MLSTQARKFNRKRDSNLRIASHIRHIDPGCDAPRLSDLMRDAGVAGGALRNGSAETMWSVGNALDPQPSIESRWQPAQIYAAQPISRWERDEGSRHQLKLSLSRRPWTQGRDGGLSRVPVFR